VIDGEVVYDLTWVDSPYVLVASGHRIYAGMFSSLVSSVRYHDVPVIKAEVPYVRASSTNGVPFQIQLIRRQLSNDIRDDSRISRFVSALGIQGW
jgi:hypothetical protein